MHAADRYQGVRRALRVGAAIYLLLGPLVAVSIPSVVHLDPTMLGASAWVVHVGAALLLAVPSLLIGGAILAVAASLGPRPDPQARPWAWALVGVYALAGLWPLSVWLGVGLRDAR